MFFLNSANFIKQEKAGDCTETAPKQHSVRTKPAQKLHSHHKNQQIPLKDKT